MVLAEHAESAKKFTQGRIRDFLCALCVLCETLSRTLPRNRIHAMHPALQRIHLQTRRHFLKDSSLGLGALALSSLLPRQTNAAPDSVINPLAARNPHYPARARRVI